MCSLSERYSVSKDCSASSAKETRHQQRRRRVFFESTMTFLGAMLSLLLPRSAWRVIQRRSRTGWRQDQFLQNAEVIRERERTIVGFPNALVG